MDPAAERFIRKEAVVRASLAKAWDAFTTPEGAAQTYHYTTLRTAVLRRQAGKRWLVVWDETKVIGGDSSDRKLAEPGAPRAGWAL